MSILNTKTEWFRWEVARGEARSPWACDHYNGNPALMRMVRADNFRDQDVGLRRYNQADDALSRRLGLV